MAPSLETQLSAERMTPNSSPDLTSRNLQCVMTAPSLLTKALLVKTSVQKSMPLTLLWAYQSERWWGVIVLLALAGFHGPLAGHRSFGGAEQRIEIRAGRAREMIFGEELAVDFDAHAIVELGETDGIGGAAAGHEGEKKQRARHEVA